jgi:uptake hydrogenase large subunit
MRTTNLPDAGILRLDPRLQTSDDMSTQDSPGDDPIRVLATHAAGRIRAVSLHIPDRAWMGGAVIGMVPAEGVEHLRQHASHSPQAHAHALALACAQAAGEAPPEKAERLRTERRLAAEMIDTHLRRLLLDWPPSLGFEPRINRYAEFHRRLLHAGEHENDFLLGGEVLDLVARELLAGFFNQIRMPHGIGEFLDRLAGGGSLSSILSELIAHGPSTVPPERRTALLGTLSADAWVATVGAWPSAEFIRHPRYGGEAAETGPLARHAASPLVRLLLERGNRISARLFAKAIDVADCASTMRHPGSEEVAPLIDACQAAPDVGVARVITARGALLCWVRLAEGRIADCAIVPAGAWNLQPDGVYCREAMCLQATAGDPEALKKRLRWLMLAIDPSLPFVVELVAEEDASAAPAST